MAVTPDPAARRPVTLRSFLPYLRGQYGLLAVAVALSLAVAAGYLAQPLLIRSTLDRVSAGGRVTGAVAVLVGTLLVAAVLSGVTNYLLQRAGEGMVLAARQRLADHLVRLPIAEYDRRRTGDLLARIGADTTLLRGAAAAAPAVVSPVVVMTGAVAMMVLVDPVMFAVTTSALLGLGLAIVIARRVRGASEQTQARVGDLTAALDRAISAVRTIRAARAEDREARAVGDHAVAAFRAGLRMATLNALVNPTTTVVFQGGLLAVLGAGGARVAAGTMTLGDLVAFVVLLLLLMIPISVLLLSYTQLQAGLGALQRIEDVLALPAETANDPPATVTTAEPAAPAVVFDRVTFGYGGEEPVLRDVSFTVPAGSRTALVGPSGAGKSTVLALVERFYGVRAGAVRVAGVDVRDQPRDALRAQLGYVEQDAPVLAGTLRDNLLLTDPTATDARLVEVLATVNLSDLVARSPDGLSAQVGEAGVLLSGGERQRLAIARTLLAAPSILLLDEPTSNLDSRNEHALQQAISAAAGRRTLLIVAHRLATVIGADQIVVLDHGRVVATGTHEELSKVSPLYRELAVHQLLAT